MAETWLRVAALSDSPERCPIHGTSIWICKACLIHWLRDCGHADLARIVADGEKIPGPRLVK